MRGVYENPLGSGIWWVHYYATGKRHREKVGRKSDAIKLYQSRKADVVAGRKLPELRNSKVVTLSELIDDVLEFVAHHKQTDLIFLNEKVDGKIPLGWMMPMLAGFRANVLWNKPKGSLSWIVPLEELVPACIEQLVNGIQDVHTQENSRPEYVGRNSIAWRMSYNAVSQAILQRELTKARQKNK